MGRRAGDRHWERWLAALIAGGLAWAIVKLADSAESVDQRSIRNEMRSIENEKEIDRLREESD